MKLLTDLQRGKKLEPRRKETKMKEFEVGERTIIECVETNEDKPFVCNKCFFYNMLPLCPQCSATNRKDGRNVIFKEVKE